MENYFYFRILPHTLKKMHVWGMCQALSALENNGLETGMTLKGENFK